MVQGNIAGTNNEMAKFFDATQVKQGRPVATYF